MLSVPISVTAQLHHPNAQGPLHLPHPPPTLRWILLDGVPVKSG